MKQLLFISSAILAFVALPGISKAAVIQFSPQSATIQQGKTVQVQISVDTQGVYANTAGVYFSYPQDKLEFVSIGGLNSSFLFIEQQGGQGVVRISAGMPTPGFVGVHKVATVTFRALAPGQAQLVISADAAVLSDQDNKNVLAASPKAAYQIQASSSSAPQTPSPLPVVPPSTIENPSFQPETPQAPLSQEKKQGINFNTAALTSPFMYAMYALALSVLGAIAVILLRMRKQKAQEQAKQEFQDISMK